MRIITAIGNPYLNDKLKEHNEFEVIGKDIQYQEGIIEILEERDDIDILILSDILPKEYGFNILINKIKRIKENIEIVVLLEERNADIENFLNSKNIYKIYYLNEFNYNEFIQNFTSKFKNKNEEISREINDFKKLILSNNESYYNDEKKNYYSKRIKQDTINENNSKDIWSKNNINNYKKYINSSKRLNISNKNKISRKKLFKKLKIKNENNINYNYEFKDSFYDENDNKVIVVTGNFGVGKSVVSSLLAKCIANKNKKTLLIDFDILNNSINTIFGIKKYPNKLDKTNIQNLIISINKNLNLFCGIDMLVDLDDEINFFKIKEILNILKKEYEFIVIDTSSQIKFKYVKTVLSSGDKIIFLVEPNLLEIKKANMLLEILIKDWNINVDKIKIVFNKTNKFQIAESILEEVFSNFEIVGNLKYDEKYNLFINKNINDLKSKDEYEKIYEKIKY